MLVHSIEFQLNMNEKIIIEFEKPLYDLSCYCEIPIIFQEKNKAYTLAVDDLHMNMLQFKKCLKRVLNLNLYLDQSLMPDPGYVYNEYLKYSLEEDEVVTSPNLKFTQEDGFEIWVGFEALIWSYGSYATWLYNQDRSIIFRITPFYSRQNKNALSYGEWLKDYEPIITVTMSKKVIEDWLKKVDEILDLIEKNRGRAVDNGNRTYEACSRTHNKSI